MSERVAAVSRLLYRKVGHTSKRVQMVKRERVAKPFISTEAIDFKAPHSAKTKQSWKYPSNNIVRASHLKISQYHDHKDSSLARRKQESNFFVTINSNKSPDSPADCDQTVKAMENVLKELKEDRVLAQCIKFGPKNPETYINDKYHDVVHSVDFKAAVETGDVMRRVHCHIWLTITHYSQIQINVKMLQIIARKAFNQVAERDNQIKDMPYVHVKLLPQSDWTDVMRQYIHKAMTA